MTLSSLIIVFLSHCESSQKIKPSAGSVLPTKSKLYACKRQTIWAFWNVHNRDAPFLTIPLQWVFQNTQELFSSWFITTNFFPVAQPLRDTVLPKETTPNISSSCYQTQNKLLVLMHWPERKVSKSAVKPASRQELTIKTIKQGEAISCLFSKSSFLTQTIWFTNSKQKSSCINGQVCSPVYTAKRNDCVHEKK